MIVAIAAMATNPPIDATIGITTLFFLLFLTHESDRHASRFGFPSTLSIRYNRNRLDFCREVITLFWLKLDEDIKVVKTDKYVSVYA